MSLDFILKATQDPGTVDGGAITSDGKGLLLREVDLIEHPVKELVAQRVYGLALGYEDLNELRNDPLLAVLFEKEDPDKEALAGE